MEQINLIEIQECGSAICQFVCARMNLGAIEVEGYSFNDLRWTALSRK